MKKLLLLSLILAMCLSMCACASAAESVPTTTPTIKVTEPPTEPKVSSVPDVDGFKSAIKDLVYQNYNYFGFSADETRINIGVAKNGLMTKVWEQKDLGNYEPWVVAKKSMLEFYDTICDTAIIYGLEDTAIYLYLLNDTNTSKAVLTILDGEVIGDFFSK